MGNSIARATLVVAITVGAMVIAALLLAVIIVAEELGSLRLHVIGKRGGLGELRKTCWTRELPGFGTRHDASGRKVYIVSARIEGRTRTVTIGNAKPRPSSALQREQATVFRNGRTFAVLVDNLP